MTIAIKTGTSRESIESAAARLRAAANPAAHARRCAT